MPAEGSTAKAGILFTAAREAKAAKEDFIQALLVIVFFIVRMFFSLSQK